MRTRFATFAAIIVPLGWFCSPAVGDDASTIASQRDKAVSQGVSFLTSAQAEDGSFSKHPGITGIAASAMLRSGRTPEDPAVAKALKFILSNRQADGGIYDKGSGHRNYETCLAVAALAEANKDGKYDDVLKGADAFLKDLQINESGGSDPSSMNYGGAGYGNNKRPDLSNTSFFIDALKQLGNGEDDEAMQRALVFVSRCQNLETEHNTSPHAAKVNDGGFYYTVAAGGQSKAGESPEGGLRSYGSMTYAGLKSMIYAGVDADDPRVKAALTWIGKHYTLDENPGMGAQGLYYYYHTFAKALSASGKDELVDAKGKSHDWRSELIEKLASLQQKDGSWLNKNGNWMEADPNLVTSYSLLALSYCKE